MKKLLNTLYVTTQGSYLHKENETVCVCVDREIRLQLPIHTLSNIVCFGKVSCSPFLMGFCGQKQVGLCFLTENGRFLARIEGPVSGNVLLRREQYRRSDNPEKCVDIAKACITGKLSNARTVLLRAIRDHGDKADMETVADASKYLKHHILILQNQNNLDSVRGLEGDAANSYFGVFNSLITSQKNDFIFDERNRRPPQDNVNALLSFLYTLLVHDVQSGLESVGLDPAVGFLHRDRPGRPSLALDIMEELRPILADRVVLYLINRQQVSESGFKKKETGGVVMNDETRKKVLIAYQERKKEEIYHSYIEQKVKLGLLPYIQALLLARHIRGDIDGYPPFLWK